MTVRRAGRAPFFYPGRSAATKLNMQVRIPPPAPQPPHLTGRRARGTPRAHEGDPLPRRLPRPRSPLPLHDTVSTEAGRSRLPRRQDRHAAKAADGAAGGLDLRGCARHRHQRPRTGARWTRWSSSSGEQKDAAPEGTPGSAFSTPPCRRADLKTMPGTTCTSTPLRCRASGRPPPVLDATSRSPLTTSGCWFPQATRWPAAGRQPSRLRLANAGSGAGATRRCHRHARRAQQFPSPCRLPPSSYGAL